MVMNAAGEPLEIEIGRGTIFSAEVYSQSQIEEIANDPLFQLKLIDKFIADEVKEIEGQLEICVRELGVNGGEILKVRGEVAALREKVSVLPEITEKLKNYKVEEGDEQGQVLQNAGEEKALRDRERRALERLQALFAETAERLREVVSALPGDVSTRRWTRPSWTARTARRSGRSETWSRMVPGKYGQRVDEAARIAEETGGYITGPKPATSRRSISNRRRLTRTSWNCATRKRTKRPSETNFFAASRNFRRNRSGLRSAARTFIRRSRPGPRCYVACRI